MLNYSRQHDMFDNTKFKTPIHVIGAGATGSWVTLFLAKLGIQDITVWDFDTVEEHNIPNQFYKPYKLLKEPKNTCPGDINSGAAYIDFYESDVEKQKVKCLEKNILDFTQIEIKAKNERVTDKQRLGGIVFCLTDTMKSRKEIFESCKMNAGVELWIETRMGLDGGRIYTINPCNFDQVGKYEETFYSDEEASVSACGTSQSIIATAVQIASMAVWQVIKFANHDDDFNNEILVDCRNSITMTQRF